MLVSVAVGACTRPAADESSPSVEACEVLRSAALRGERCDPQLGRLAAMLASRGDEAECTAAVRTMLGEGDWDATQPVATGSDATRPAVRSVYLARPPADPSPLTADEVAAVAALRLPATIAISPDVGRVPGIPPTSASLDGTPIDADAEGRLTADVAAGRHSIRLRHAGRESVWCLTLRACETLEVVAHGAQLARHVDAQTGPCAPPDASQ